MTDYCDEISFVEELVDIHHECLVCLQLLREPWIVECCGHHLCKPCIDKLVHDKKGCPHCRKLKFRYVRDKNLQRILLGKRVFCKYKCRGCEWQGTLREVDCHCSTKLRCEWCMLELLCYEMKRHNEVCVVASELIECDLQPFGCTKRFPRKNKKEHMQNNCREHVSILKQTCEDLSLRMGVLRDENTKLEGEKRLLAAESNMEAKENNELKKEIEALKKMYAKSQRRFQDLKNRTETMILKNADATLLGCVHELREERDEITMKLKDSEVKVKALLDEVWSYKFVAVIAFFVALLIGIILRHFSPTLSLMVVHLLLLTFSLTPLFGWYWATQIN